MEYMLQSYSRVFLYSELLQETFATDGRWSFQSCWYVYVYILCYLNYTSVCMYIGGYHKEKGLVLVMDVARFKYPPFWVPVDVLWESMEVLDKVTGLPRGYFVVSTEKHEGVVPPGIHAMECHHAHPNAYDSTANSDISISSITTIDTNNSNNNNNSANTNTNNANNNSKSEFYSMHTDIHPTMTCPPGILGWGSEVV